jgi:hypothetical protein
LYKVRVIFLISVLDALMLRHGVSATRFRLPYSIGVCVMSGDPGGASSTLIYRGSAYQILLFRAFPDIVIRVLLGLQSSYV